jgi:hypothetical protein
VALSLQAVHDPASDQNFRQIANQFPIQGANLAGVLMLVSGEAKVAVGKAEATYGGGSVEATQVITHGLGREVKFADISVEDAGYVDGTASYGATTFTAKVQKRDGTSPANGTKAVFHWIAIG